MAKMQSGNESTKWLILGEHIINTDYIICVTYTDKDSPPFGSSFVSIKCVDSDPIEVRGQDAGVIWDWFQTIGRSYPQPDWPKGNSPVERRRIADSGNVAPRHAVSDKGRQTLGINDADESGQGQMSRW